MGAAVAAVVAGAGEGAGAGVSWAKVAAVTKDTARRARVERKRGKGVKSMPPGKLSVMGV
jgi:hypothetical protein